MFGFSLHVLDTNPTNFYKIVILLFWTPYSTPLHMCCRSIHC